MKFTSLVLALLLTLVGPLNAAMMAWAVPHDVALTGPLHPHGHERAAPGHAHDDGHGHGHAQAHAQAHSQDLAHPQDHADMSGHSPDVGGGAFHSHDLSPHFTAIMPASQAMTVIALPARLLPAGTDQIVPGLLARIERPPKQAA